MKTSQKIVSLFATVLIAVVFLFGNTVLAQAAAKPWPVPAKDKAMKATVKLTDAKVIATGKELYAKHCKSCHGTVGEGDGPKASSMKTKIESFKDSKFQAQSDNDIYYQIVVGRDEMPAFDKKLLDEEDRWALVNYVRTLK